MPIRRLADLHYRSGRLKLFFDLFRLALADGFFDGGRGGLDQLLGFLQTQSRDLTDGLDYVDLVRPYLLNRHVELSLLLFCGCGLGGARNPLHGGHGHVGGGAAVACIAGSGGVETDARMASDGAKGDKIARAALLRRLVELQYRGTDADFARGCFRVRGDVIEIFPAHYEDRAWRLSLFGDEVEEIGEFYPLTGSTTAALQSLNVYANRHHVPPRPPLRQALPRLRAALAAQPARRP